MFLELCQDAESYLNRHVVKLVGTDAVFYVHYWGAVPEHRDNPLHKHSFFEVCYVLDGEGVYLDDGVSYNLQQHTLFCSRPGIWHQIRSRAGLLLLFVAFEIVESESTPESVRRYKEMESSSTFFAAESEKTATTHLWKALLVQAAAASPFLRGPILHLSHHLLLSFVQAFTADRGESDVERTSRSDTTQLHQAKLFIRDNLSLPLRLHDVASYLHVSVRHVSRLFATEPGQTFTSYIRQERIQQATTMLKTSHLSIKNIAQETGFDTVHYFTRVFTSEIGISPARYRQQAMNHSAQTQ